MVQVLDGTSKKVPNTPVNDIGLKIAGKLVQNGSRNN